jgi:hypothetical protein
MPKTLAGSAIVRGEDGRQALDDGGETLRTPHSDDGDGRLADGGHGVDRLHLLRRKIDVRGVLPLALGAVFTGPRRTAANVEDDRVGCFRCGDRGGNVRRLGRHHI